MSYTFVKITDFYKDFLSGYYKKNKSIIINLCYEDQFDHLMAEGFGWSDYYAKNLRKLGINAIEIVANAHHLQKTWANENNCKRISREDIIFCQLKKIRPEVVFFESYNFSIDLIKKIRSEITTIKLMIYWCATPYRKFEIAKFRFLDVMLSSVPLFVEDFKRLGMDAYLLHHGFEESLLQKINNVENSKKTDLIFIGSLLAGDGFHNQRIKLFHNLIMNNLKIKIHGELLKDYYIRNLLLQFSYVAGSVLKSINLEDFARKLPGIQVGVEMKNFPKFQREIWAFRKVIDKKLYGIEMYKAIKKAQIGLNIHADIAGAYAGNIRLFEVTGVGTCLLTDWKKNITELFDVDKEIVTYKSIEECKEKITWLINHPLEMNEIALAGQKRCLSDHNYYIRAQQLNKIILNYLN